MTENGDKKEFGLPGVCGIALFTVLFVSRICFACRGNGDDGRACRIVEKSALLRRAASRNRRSHAYLEKRSRRRDTCRACPLGHRARACYAHSPQRAFARPFGRDLVCGDRRCGILHLLHRLLRRNFKRNGGFRRPLHRICFGNICGTCRK